MSNDERFVNLLFGNTATPPPEAPDARSPLDELAKKFYGDPAAAPAAPPEPGPMFDRFLALRSNLEKDGDTLHDTLGLSAAERETDNRAFVKMADDLELDDRTLLDLHRQVTRGLTESVALDADADDTAAVHARNATVRQKLREQLGEQAAADVIDRTQRFIEATPELEQLVNRGAVATRADVFLTIADHVQAKRWQ